MEFNESNRITNDPCRRELRAIWSEHLSNAIIYPRIVKCLKCKTWSYRYNDRRNCGSCGSQLIDSPTKDRPKMGTGKFVKYKTPYGIYKYVDKDAKDWYKSLEGSLVEIANPNYKKQLEEYNK